MEEEGTFEWDGRSIIIFCRHSDSEGIKPRDIKQRNRQEVGGHIKSGESLKICNTDRSVKKATSSHAESRIQG